MWQLLKENTAAYRGSPPCTQSQLIPTETGTGTAMYYSQTGMSYVAVDQVRQWQGRKKKLNEGKTCLFFFDQCIVLPRHSLTQ